MLLITTVNQRRKDTDSTPEHSTRKESRWSRPTLYITVVGIYLLLMGTVLLSVIGYYSISVGIVPAVMTPGIAAVFLYIPYLVTAGTIVSWVTFFIAGGPAIWAVPSVIGAVLLLQGKKRGALISLAALILLIASSIVSSIFLVQTAQGLLIMIPLIASSSITLAFLIAGWKRVRWRSVSSEHKSGLGPPE